MDWNAALAEENRDLATYRAEAPETAAGFTALHHAAMAEGELDVKTKELIALGIGIAKQCIDCIGYHVIAAKKAGATRKEVTETISVAIMMGGGPAYMYGAKALSAFDQLD